MRTWEKASRGDLLRGEAISLIFLNHPQLNDFFFDRNFASLTNSPSEILRLSKSFSSGERMLIRVALDIWSGKGEAKIADLLESLDEDNIANILNGLHFLLRGFSDN